MIEDPEEYEKAAVMISECAERVQKNFPPSREVSLALTKLDEACHWLTAKLVLVEEANANAASK